jgi:hypothetical protein
LAAGVEASQAEEPFGQETVDVRPPHQPAAAARPPHRHSQGSDEHRHEGHRHGDRRTAHTHRHAEAGHRHGEAGHRHGDDQHDHGIETENLFGFTLGSDVEPAGAKGIALEAVGRFGKRTGSYETVGKKLEFAMGVTDRISVAFGAFTSYHRVAGVADLEDVKKYAFNGFGAEVRWRLLDRKTHPFGMTIHIEPSVQTHDELTGQPGTKYGVENKLILDSELIKDRLFAAFNLIYEVEKVREHGSDGWEKGSKIGAAIAATYQFVPNRFAGAELRYLRAYEGLTLDTWAGEALYVGPTLFVRITPKIWLAAAWNAQVAGKEAGSDQRLDLANFERHQARLKVGAEF